MKRALLAVPLAAALLAWFRGVVDAGFDYDEVMQAHSIWLIAQGLVPFRDFFECHPPFAWYPFVPVLALLPDAPELLFGLRLLSLVGNLAWIAALFGAARAARPTLRSEWLFVSAAFAASHATVIGYAPQFRPDPWVWAAAFTALARAIRAPAGLRRAAELGLAGSLCALALPKLALLFPCYVAIDLTRRLGPSIPRELAGYALGIGLAIALAIGFLVVVGIDPLEAFDLSIRYHGDVAAHFGTPHGLWKELIGSERISLAVALAGLVAWATWLRDRHETPTTLELTVLTSLALQIALVPFSYIQYTAPVYVLAAIFLPYCGEWVHALADRRPWAPQAVLAGAGALAVGLAAHALAAGGSAPDAERFAQVQNAVIELAPSDEPILVAPPFHPIVRRDALYGLIQTPMPSGVTTEETLRRLGVPAAARFGTEVYRRELEQSRPAVVLFTGQPEFFYSGEQAKAIAGYLSDHARDYRRVVGLEPALWVRADLVAAAGPRAE
jgi:hypothetical protein